MLVEYNWDDQTECATFRYADGRRYYESRPLVVQPDLDEYLAYEAFWARTQRR